jgi:hypothetical protein
MSDKRMQALRSACIALLSAEDAFHDLGRFVEAREATYDPADQEPGFFACRAMKQLAERHSRVCREHAERLRAVAAPRGCQKVSLDT